MKKIFSLLALSFLLFSCKEKEVFVFFKNTEVFQAEQVWLEEIFYNEPKVEAAGIQIGDSADEFADIVIEFFSFWDYENFSSTEEFFIVSRTWYAPKENSLVNRKNTTLEFCIEDGNEEIIPLSKITPPDIALRVDGFAADNENYQLIRNVGIKIRMNEDKKGLKNRIAKTEILTEILRNAEKPLIQERPTVTWISAAGDVMLGRNAGNILLREGAKALFGGTLEFLAAADIALINLEGPLSSRGTMAAKTFTFRFEPPRELAFALKNAGIDAVLFSNNHTFDYGDIAFLDTLNYLDEAGIGILGAGRNLEAILQPVCFLKNNFQVNIWGIGSFPTERTGWTGHEHIATADKHGFLLAARGGAAALKQRFKEDGLNVVKFHGGAEWSRSPDRPTRELYTDMARAGADLILGSHPHIVQGFEWIDNEKLIFWSLGNFIFSGMQETGGGDEGLLIRLGYIGKQPVYIEPFAVALNGPRVELEPDEKLAVFYQRSRALLN